MMGGVGGDGASPPTTLRCHLPGGEGGQMWSEVEGWHVAGCRAVEAQGSSWWHSIPPSPSLPPPTVILDRQFASVIYKECIGLASHGNE